MSHLIAVVLLASPWIENADFSRAQQEKAYSATLRLKTTNGDIGTAVRVAWLKDNKRAFYLTAAHVVGNEKYVGLDEFDPKTGKVSETINARVIETWPAEDLAILAATESVEPVVMPVCPLASIPTKTPFPVLSLGCPLGAPEIWADEAQAKVDLHKVELGTKSFFWRVQKQSVIGRSGGPIMGKNGYLVGICSGNTKEKTYYVHIDEIRKCLKRPAFAAIFPEDPGKSGQNQKN